jgi:FkbM family methyltransferase
LRCEEELTIMVIQTESTRLVLAANAVRFLPIFSSGYVARWLYPMEFAQKERVSFTRRSSLADIVFRASELNHINLVFALRGFYEWRNIVIVNTLCHEGDTIIDVGSNIGTETLLFAKRVGNQGKVFAFEPLPSNFSILKEMVELNKLKNVELFQAAVADKAGRLRFLPPPEDWSVGEGRIMKDEAKRYNEIEVESLVLDQMFKSGKLFSPRMLVMDVEGAELSVLHGAERILIECRPFIILEWNPELLAKHHSPLDLYHFLEERHYKMWEISTYGLIPASPEELKLKNFLCIPNGSVTESIQLTRLVSRKLFYALFLPAIKGLNPAVVSDSKN